MLVLTRKLGERIQIGDRISITVVEIERGKIRLGIEAPRDIPVFREELVSFKTPTEEAPMIVMAKERV